MAAPTITSARGLEAEQSATPLNEPSMEDILASIRRIIAEDQSQGLARSGLTGLTRRHQPSEAPAEVEPPASALEPPASPPAEASGPLPVEQEADLHQASQADLLRTSYEGEAAHAEPAAADHGDAFQFMQPEAYHPATQAGPVADAQPPAFEAPSYEAAVPREAEAGPLMSSSAGASITSSFQALAESMVFQDPALVERIMRETMRPLLKEWLDDHLPSIVERLVRAEIERVARGGRSRD